MEINVTQLLIQLLGAGGVIAVIVQQMNARANAREQAAQQRHAAELQSLTARLNTEAQREKQSGDLDLGYVDRLQKRVEDLETDKDRLMHEREQIQERRLHAEHRAIDMAEIASNLFHELSREPDKRVLDVLMGNDAPVAGTMVVPGTPPQVVTVSPVIEPTMDTTVAPTPLPMRPQH